MAKVILWTKPDGSVSITHAMWNKKPLNVTDEVFLNRIADKLVRDNPATFGTYTRAIKESSDLPTDRAQRDKWRLKPSGKVEVDPSATTPNERLQQKRAAVRAKLTSGQPLTQEEAELIV